jgi:hypothetical protein
MLCLREQHTLTDGLRRLFDMLMGWQRRLNSSLELREEIVGSRHVMWLYCRVPK